MCRLQKYVAIALTVKRRATTPDVGKLPQLKVYLDGDKDNEDLFEQVRNGGVESEKYGETDSASGVIDEIEYWMNTKLDFWKADPGYSIKVCGFVNIGDPGYESDLSEDFERLWNRPTAVDHVMCMQFVLPSLQRTIQHLYYRTSVSRTNTQGLRPCGSGLGCLHSTPYCVILILRSTMPYLTRCLSLIRYETVTVETVSVL